MNRLLSTTSLTPPQPSELVVSPWFNHPQMLSPNFNRSRELDSWREGLFLYATPPMTPAEYEQSPSLFDHRPRGWIWLDEASTISEEIFRR